MLQMDLESDRRRNEEATALLAAIVDSSDDAIISKSLDGIIRSWNAGAERIFGYTAAEAVGKPITLIIPPDLHDEEKAILERLWTSQKIEQYETVRISKEGRRLDISLTISPLRDADGRIVGASKVARDITDRKQAEKALRESQERLRLALDAGRMGTWEWNIETNEVTWSEGLEAIHGLEPGAFGGTFEAFEADIHLDDRENVRSSIARSLYDRTEHHIDYRIIRPDGTLRWVEARGKLIRNDDGVPVRMVGICGDVTERKQAEEALSESKERFSRFMAQLPGLAWIKDVKGRYVYANDAAVAAFQAPREDLYGKTDEEIFSPEMAAEFRENDRRALASEAGVQAVETLEHSDGVLHHSLVSKFPIPGPDGLPSWVGGVAIDITEHKRAEEALRAKEAELELITETTPLILSRCSRDLRYRFVNRAAAALFGMTPEQVIGKPIVEVMGKETFEFIRPHIEQVLQGNPVEYEAELPYQVGPRWVRVHYVPERDAEGQVQGWIASIIDITRRKEAERKLQESQSHLQLTTEAAQVGTWQWHIRADDLWWSPIHKKLWGYEPDLQPMTYEHWARAVDEEDLLRAEAAIQACFERNQEYDVEYRITREDNQQRRWIRSTGRAVFDKTGRAESLLGISFDITDRRRAEEALRESENRYRAIVEGQAELVCRFRSDGTILFANGAYALARGTTPEKLVGTNFWDFIQEEDRPSVRAMLDELSPDSPEVRIENRFEAAEGLRWTLWTNRALVFDAGGRAVEVQSSGMDITERKQLEQSLRFLSEASKSLSSLVDYRSTLQQVARLAVPYFADWCAVDMLDEEGNPCRLAVAHVDPDKVQLAEELHQNYVPDLENSRGVAKVLRTGEPEMVAEITEEMLEHAARDDAQLRILRELRLTSYLCVPLKVKNRTLGAMTYVSAESGRRYGPHDLAMAEDLAHRASIAIENARLYQELQENDRRKDEFLAMLAHELRNPLAPIRSGLDILAMESDEDQETIGLMREQVQHLVRLVDDLLDVSRIVRGRIELRTEAVEVSTLIERSVEASRSAIDRRDQELVVRVPPQPIWLIADTVRMVQVIENLLNNAFKYTDPGGRIELSAERIGERAVIIVRDTGIGIEPDLLPNVFDLFTQSARTLDRAQGGLGIGLTLVRRLVEMHGGSISAHSDGPGQGSTFTIRLPAAAKPTVSRGADRPARTGRPRRILVVDDNVGAARMLALLLSKLDDHEVEVAHDGRSALASIRQSHPEIVLLDIGLPDVDGYQVARSVRAQQDLDDVLLVAVTGYGQEKDRQRSRAAGFNHHLVKPLEVSELEALLRDGCPTSGAGSPLRQ